jgi:hypothetical protein
VFAEGERMTESEWLACADPTPMLEFLRARASDRKLRLFACACYRRLWGLLDKSERQAVESAEWRADGKASAGKLERARRPGQFSSGHAGWAVAAADAYQAASRASFCAARRAAQGADKERIAQASLLRDVFGDSFRPAAADPGWLSWDAGRVTRLAQSAYGGWQFGSLPILGDALEDAGCADADILGHLRGPGPHVRGCWAIDLLLGKE